MSKTEREFDSLATEYESNRLSGWYKAHSEIIQKHCKNIDEGYILDVGCGTGYLLRSYLKDKPNVRAVGIDISSAMIEQAKKESNDKELEQIDFIKADWESLDTHYLQKYQFKIIFCANTYHYFRDPQAATFKFYQHLTNDGLLYLLERNKTRSSLTLLWEAIHRTVIKDNVTFYHSTELVKFYKNAGFKQLRSLCSINKLFWKKKFFTSIILLEGIKKYK